MFERVPVLSAQECERVRQSVRALRSRWVARGSAEHPFYTVGAASYIDAVPDPSAARYSALAAQTNPLLREHFAWLYVRLLNRLSLHLQAVVQTADELALPGFHVWQGPCVPTWPLSIHFDLQYRSIPWPDVKRADLSQPLSFTLAIALPRRGGGLNSWDLHYPDLVAEQSADLERPWPSMEELTRGRAPDFHAYEPGVLSLHSGHVLHQIAAVNEAFDDDERITLQGHGLYCDGAWTLYW